MLQGAIVGCGFFGQIQLEAWRRMDGVRIVAAVDQDLTRAQISAPRAYTNAEEFFNQGSKSQIGECAIFLVGE